MKQKQNETEHLLSTEENRNRLLEDAAERLYPDCSNVLRQMAKETFVNGAKWQQERSYSEEDLKEAFAIGFAEWLLIIYNEDIIYDAYTKEELLEIYKKEKAL
jgi:tRNA A37 N6-isopentenylltransferase MiaA